MRIIVILLMACLGASLAEARPYRTAVFDMELVDTSLEGKIRGVRDDETRRIALATAELKRLLTASGQIELVDLQPKAAEIAEKSPLFKCNGCDQDIARALGAELEVSAVVQKTSNLILSFTISITDLRNQKVLRGGATDIRGNTDEMWLRGVRYLVKNRLLETPLPELP